MIAERPIAERPIAGVGAASPPPPPPPPLPPSVATIPTQSSMGAQVAHWQWLSTQLTGGFRATHVPVVPPPPPPPSVPSIPTQSSMGALVAYLDWQTRQFSDAVKQYLPPGTVVLPPSPLPQAGAAGKAFIPQDSRADPSTRGAIDRMREPLNSLIGQGRLVKLSNQTETWTVGGGLLAVRAPAAADDLSIGALPGMTWINTALNRVYICVSNASGAAVWLELATA
jgi:hypothetical protein